MIAGIWVKGMTDVINLMMVATMMITMMIIMMILVRIMMVYCSQGSR